MARYRHRHRHENASAASSNRFSTIRAAALLLVLVLLGGGIAVNRVLVLKTSHDNVSGTDANQQQEEALHQVPVRILDDMPVHNFLPESPQAQQQEEDWEEDEFYNWKEEINPNNLTLPPLLINAGLAYTNVKQFFRATCRLGLPSVHWKKYCLHPIRNHTTNATTTATTPATNTQTQEQQEQQQLQLLQQGIKAHFHFVKLYTDATLCIVFHLDCPPNALLWSNQVKRTISHIVSSNVIALHGDPYPMAWSYMMEELHKVKRKGMVLVMTRRYEKVWPHRNMKRSRRLICKDYIQYENHHHDATKEEEQQEDHAQPKSPHEVDYTQFFDLVACIDRMAQQQQQRQQQSFSKRPLQNPKALQLTDVFTYYGELPHDIPFKLFSTALRAYTKEKFQTPKNQRIRMSILLQDLSTNLTVDAAMRKEEEEEGIKEWKEVDETEEQVLERMLDMLRNLTLEEEKDVYGGWKEVLSPFWQEDGDDKFDKEEREGGQGERNAQKGVSLQPLKGNLNYK